MLHLNIEDISSVKAKQYITLSHYTSIHLGDQSLVDIICQIPTIRQWWHCESSNASPQHTAVINDGTLGPNLPLYIVQDDII